MGWGGWLDGWMEILLVKRYYTLFVVVVVVGIVYRR